MHVQCLLLYVCVDMHIVLRLMYAMQSGLERTSGALQLYICHESRQDMVLANLMHSNRTSRCTLAWL